MPQNDYIRTLPEYDKHHFVTFLHDETTGMEAFIAIHRKNERVPSFGATRLWQYASDSDALKDALRLSKMMSYKAALAGLPCGGAKGVIIDKPSQQGRHLDILRAYARDIAMLKDSFITGTDVGIKQDDLSAMKKVAPNIIGFNDNSTEFTGLGVYHGIRCALRAVFNDDSVKGKTFAIQGLGKIGGALLGHLAPDADKIFVADVNEENVLKAADAYPNVEIVGHEVIHQGKVDVFCPCAMGSAINAENVASLNCDIVAGGANNQLESEQVGDILHKMKILYAPDFVINAGGLIAVYDEYEHTENYNYERVREKVIMIEKRLQHVFEESRLHDKPTNRVANSHAEMIFSSYA